MEQIYSCKLYRASSRKQKIQSALASPVNQPLVKQLREYLDDEYIRKDILEPVSKRVKEHTVPAEPEIDDNSESGSSASTHITPKMHDRMSSETDYDDNEDDSSDIQVEDGGEGVKSSIKASLESVSIIDIDSLKGLLNSTDNTSGVIRAKHDNEKCELWLYYNDAVNLNDVMTPTIELIEAANYYYLTFSRLARSANAMVFEVSLDCSITGTADNGGTDNE